MMTINIVAAGIVVIAAALSICRTFDQQAAGVADSERGGGLSVSDRGITLQTLIVTAVLVLMAVAAGVVIVAITNSSSDDLEEQSPDLEGRCTGTEIYDPILAAAGVEGEVVGTTVIFQGNARPVNVKGSAVGCIPVCFWIEPDGGEERIGSGEIEFIREYSEYEGAKQFQVNIPVGGGSNFAAVFRDPFTIAHPLGGVDYPLIDPSRGSDSNLFSSSLVDAAEVRVGPSQDDCFIYNSSGQIVG